MNIIIQVKQPCSFLNAVSKVLSGIGHNVILWNAKVRNIYEMTHEAKPELLFIQDGLSTKHWDAIKDIPYILYGENDLLGKALVKLSPFQNEDGFIDLITYRQAFPNDKFKTDVLVSSNYCDNSELVSFMDQFIYQYPYTIKCVGNVRMPSVFFIAQTNDQEFLSIAKASKVVITTNKIEQASLIYNKVFTLMLDEVDNISQLITEDKLRRKKLKEQRTELLDKNKTSIHITSKLLKLIGREEDSIKAKQLLGKLL